MKNPWLGLQIAFQLIMLGMIVGGIPQWAWLPAVFGGYYWGRSRPADGSEAALDAPDLFIEAPKLATQETLDLYALTPPVRP